MEVVTRAEVGPQYLTFPFFTYRAACTTSHLSGRDVIYHSFNMSFGWSAGDIATTISTLITVVNALKDSGGSRSEFQASVQFLESVERTLSGIQSIVDNNPDLQCEENLKRQVDIVKSAIANFERKIAKYNASLGVDSTRPKIRTIPREIQLALSTSVKDLQRDISQQQLVLGLFISLQTL